MYKSKLISIKEFIKILNNLSPNYQIRVYHKKKKGRGKPVSKPTEGKMTLTKLAQEMRDGFKRIDNRIDNLEKDINTRLDYIVKANNLKDSK